jgi:hypothetical protein
MIVPGLFLALGSLDVLCAESPADNEPSALSKIIDQIPVSKNRTMAVRKSSLRMVAIRKAQETGMNVRCYCGQVKEMTMEMDSILESLKGSASSANEMKGQLNALLGKSQTAVEKARIYAQNTKRYAALAQDETTLELAESLQERANEAQNEVKRRETAVNACFGK